MDKRYLGTAIGNAFNAVNPTGWSAILGGGPDAAKAADLLASAARTLPLGPFGSVADMEQFLKNHYDAQAVGRGNWGDSDVQAGPAADAALRVTKGGSLGKSVEGANIGAGSVQAQRGIEAKISRLIEHVIAQDAVLDRLTALNNRLSGPAPVGPQQADLPEPSPADCSMSRLGYWLSRASDMTSQIQAELTRLESVA